MRDYRKEKFISRFRNANISRTEAERKYKLKIEEEEELERKRIFEAMNSRAVQEALEAGGASAAVGGTTGGSLPSNSIEYVVDTTSSANADFEVTVSADTNVTVTWGDGQTEEILVTSGASPFEFDHIYDVSGAGISYTIRVTFDNIENVTELEFYS